MSNVCFNILPPLFLLFLFGSCHYIYIYYYCLGEVKILQDKITYLVLINIITVMWLWSFFATMLSSVGRVPLEYKFNRNQHNALLKARTEDDKDVILEKFCEDNNLLLHTCTPTGSIRYCTTCMHIKPDRTHHCATCEVCFLKMDHHCPFLNNCIGYLNYKHFLLLILYTFLYCFFFVGSTISYIIFTIDNASHYGTNIAIGLGFGLAVIMGVVTFGFLCYHLYLVGRNETTLENVHNPNFVEDDLTFDLGAQQNVIEVFGDKWYLWLLPIFSSMGCGHMYLVERK